MFGKEKKTQKALGELFEGLKEAPWFWEAYEGDDKAADRSLKGYFGQIDAFVDAGFDVDTPNQQSKCTLLVHACYKGDLPVVKHLVESGADIHRMAYDEPGLDTHGPLAAACAGASVEVVEYLLAAGADSTVVDAAGRSAEDRIENSMAIASRFGNPVERLTKCLEVLSAGSGASADADAPVPTLVAGDSGEELCTAVRDGDLACVEQLLDGGANPDTVDEEGRPAIGWAAALGHLDILRALLSKGADPDLAAPDGTTPIEVAGKTAGTEAAKILLEANANPNTRSDSGATPLTGAASVGATELVRMLLDAGANVDTLGPSDAPAILYAAQDGHLEIVDLLLQRGASPDLQSQSGLTALMQATSECYYPIVKRLLEGGASADVENEMGFTARVMAGSGAMLNSSRKAEFEEIGALLEQYESG